jgi:hypothetical protein
VFFGLRGLKISYVGFGQVGLGGARSKQQEIVIVVDSALCSPKDGGADLRDAIDSDVRHSRASLTSRLLNNAQARSQQVRTKHNQKFNDKLTTRIETHRPPSKRPSPSTLSSTSQSPLPGPAPRTRGLGYKPADVDCGNWNGQWLTSREQHRRTAPVASRRRRCGLHRRGKEHLREEVECGGLCRRCWWGGGLGLWVGTRERGEGQCCWACVVGLQGRRGGLEAGCEVRNIDIVECCHI